MSAYAFRTPSGHVEELLSLGFDLTDWQAPPAKAGAAGPNQAEYWGREARPNDHFWSL